MLLFNDDCFNVFPLLQNDYIDLILCDSPYEKTRNKWDKQLNLNSLYTQYKRVLKPKGIIILTSIQPYTSVLINTSFDYVPFRYSLIWHKTNPVGFLNAKKMPLRAHEDISVFYCHLGTYNPIKSIGNKRKISTSEHKKNAKKKQLIMVNQKN